MHHFSRGGLSAERLTVLSYYILDGRYSRDVSALRRIVWQGDTDVRYVAQVQVLAAGLGSTDTAANLVTEFARVTRAPIIDLLQSAVEAMERSTANNPVLQEAP